MSVFVVCSNCAQHIVHIVVHDMAIASDPGSLCKGRQSCGKLHRVQDLRKEATAGVSVYVQLLLGVACEACGSRPHCLVLALNRATYSTIEGLYYSVQLYDTVVVLPVCSYVWVSKQWAL